MDHIKELKQAILGKFCTVVRGEPDWRLELGPDAIVFLPWPWRIVRERRVAVASEDDGQWFGLPEPFDVELRANECLALQPVRSVSIDPNLGDMRIEFSTALSFDAITQSAGYEGWRAYFKARHKQWEVIVLGGGDFAVVEHEGLPLKPD